MKIKITLSILLLVIVAFLCLLITSKLSSAPQLPSIGYKNMMYGFSVALPNDWKGYSATTDKWTGNAINDQLGEKAFTNGPVISIHNPKWTGVNSYQDIPIMIFTLDQWNLLQEDKFHIGAAPFGPSELGRNSKYIFALPARYNYAYPLGYEEVDKIIQSKPLTAF